MFSVDISYSEDRKNWKEKNIPYKDVGVYPIFVRFKKNNYEDKVCEGVLEIQPLKVTVTPKNHSKLYGEKDNEED